MTIATLRWKVIKVLGSGSAYHSNLVFNASANPGLFGQFGVPLNLSYVPQVLSPTITYHQTIRNMLSSQLGITLKDQKFPYRLSATVLNNEVSLNLQVRLFQPNILSLTVGLSGVPAENEPKQLIDVQRLDLIHPVSDIVQWTMGMAEALDHRDFDPLQPLRYEPAVFLNDICPPGDFQNHVESNLATYIGILIRNESYRLMNREIPERVVNKNRNHNLKSSQELLLMDKQGVMLLAPSTSEELRSVRERFYRAHDLFEIGLVLSYFLSNYPYLRSTQEDFADFILYRIQNWISEPDVVFTQSMTNGLIWRLLIDEFKLKPLFEQVMKREKVVAALQEKSPFFDQFAENWWRDEHFADVLSRKITESTELDLGFLKNKDLKDLILEDYLEAKRSLQSHNYKATVLLCGSIVEAILTAVVDQKGLVSTNVLYRDYVLDSLMALAKDKNLLKDRSLYSLIDPLRNYRNTIHPGVQIRKSITLNLSIAKIALEIVRLLVKDINKP